MPHFLTKYQVLGTDISAASYQTGIEALCHLRKLPRPSAVSAVNTHLISLARHDIRFARVLKKFDLLLPDGMPLVWAMNRAGAKLEDRVYGPYFMKEALIQLPRPWKHFFFGGSAECLASLTSAALKLQPELDIVGTYSPPFQDWKEEDEKLFAEIIQENQPDFIWVALGGERQEKWIDKNLHRHKKGVFLAIGDAFELLAERRPFAPDLVQKLGLTWLYRLAQEPKRLWPRYLKFNSLFIFYSFLECFLSFLGLKTKEVTAKVSIAFIGSRGIPARYSGFETVVEELGARLVERGFDVTVYNRLSYYQKKIASLKGMRIVWLPTIPRKSLDTVIHTLLSTLHALFSRYDIVYVCGVGNAPISGILNRFSKSKLIINVDGADYRRKKWGILAQSWLKSSELKAVQHADALIADNQTVVERYQKTYKVNPTYLSYGARLESTAINCGELEKWGLKKRNYFLFVSRLSPENEADLALRAYRKFKHETHLKDSNRDDYPKLVIVGSAGYEKAYYAELEKLGDDDDVIFTGGRFEEAYAELSQNSLAFLMPATIEATRLVLVDQLGFGALIIYRDCLATQEVVGTAGIAFSGEEPEKELAEKMFFVWKNPEPVATLRNQASQRAQEQYDWDRVTCEYEKLFQQLLA